MHVQTEFPPPEIEMYINENTSGKTNNSVEDAFLQINGSYRIRYNQDFYFNSDVMTTETSQTARGIFLVIFVVIGVVFNVFMIVSIVPNRRLRSVRNILLVHLGCTGLILTFLINLVTAVVSFTGSWFGGNILCQMYGYTLTTLTLMTSWTITGLSWDKYQTIACPLHHSFTAKAKKLVVIFAIMWTLACTLSLPPLLGNSRFVYHSEKGICFVCTKTVTGRIYLTFFLIAGIYVPLIIMLFCYTHIYRIARNQSSRIAATMIQMTCVIQATITPNSQATSLSIKGTKAMCTIVQLVGAFVVVYIPISVILLTEMFSTEHFQIHTGLSSSVTMLFLSAPVVHSSVYGLRNKALRLSFRRYLRRKLRYYCYKDKRKNSVKSFKSFRSSSFKAAMLARRNGSGPGLRRTQSFPVRSIRGIPRSTRAYAVNNSESLKTPLKDPMARPHSFNVLVPEAISEISEGNLDLSGADDLLDFTADDVPVIAADDIPDIDADVNV